MRGAVGLHGRVHSRHLRRPEQRADHAADRGRAVQADPIKPMLKAPGCERSKLKCDDLLSNVDFIACCAATQRSSTQSAASGKRRRQGLTLVHVRAQLEQLKDTFIS